MRVFAKRLKELREFKGMTRKELGELSGVDASLITRYEQGTRSPTADNLLKIARALGTSTDYLLGLTDNPQPWSDDVPDLLKEKLKRLELLEEFYHAVIEAAEKLKHER